MVVKQENNKLSLIKEENNKKIEKYEILLSKIHNNITELKIENDEIYMDYNKTKRKIQKIINVGGITSIVVLTMPIASQSLLAAISLSGYFLGELTLSQNSIKNFINKEINTDKYIEKNKDINELEEYKKRLENTLCVRNFLKSILDNEYIAMFEVEEIHDIFYKDDVFYCFSDNEYKILNDYIEKYIEKEKVKIKK